MPFDWQVLQSIRIHIRNWHRWAWDYPNHSTYCSVFPWLVDCPTDCPMTHRTNWGLKLKMVIENKAWTNQNDRIMDQEWSQNGNFEKSPTRQRHLWLKWLEYFRFRRNKPLLKHFRRRNLNHRLKEEIDHLNQQGVWHLDFELEISQLKTRCTLFIDLLKKRGL